MADQLILQLLEKASHIDWQQVPPNIVANLLAMYVVCLGKSASNSISKFVKRAREELAPDSGRATLQRLEAIAEQENLDVDQQKLANELTLLIGSNRILIKLVHEFVVDVEQKKIEILGSLQEHRLESSKRHDELLVLFQRVFGLIENQQQAVITPRINNAPPHNPHFTGREDLINDLRQKLLTKGRTALTTLNGLGGIGKTQIAIEYCFRHRNDYDVIWWINSEDSDTLKAQLSNLAYALRFGQEQLQGEEARKKAVMDWLRDLTRQRIQCLLIFDNAKSEAQLSEFLGNCDGHTIITSRNPNWGGSRMDVQVMTKEEAVKFLVSRTGQNPAGADELSEKLGLLPLAIAQAGAYIEQLGITFKAYQSILEKQGIKLFESDRSYISESKYSDTVASTWRLAMEAIKERDKVAGEILDLCAWISPDKIPLELIRVATKSESTEQLDISLTCLRDFSLVQRNNNHISVHRLVQAVTRDMMDPTSKTQCIRTLASALEFKSWYVEGDAETKKIYFLNDWLECATTLAQHNEFEQLTSVEQASLVFHIAANHFINEQPLSLLLGSSNGTALMERGGKVLSNVTDSDLMKAARAAGYGWRKVLPFIDHYGTIAYLLSLRQLRDRVLTINAIEVGEFFYAYADMCRRVDGLKNSLKYYEVALRNFQQSPLDHEKQISDIEKRIAMATSRPQ